MADIDLENAVSQFYEDESLTDALTDQPASALLRWGEGQLQVLAEKCTDEDEFDQQFTWLRKLIRTMSEYIAEHQQMELEQQQVVVQKMNDFATALGFKMQTATETLIEQQKDLADEASVNHLLGILKGDETEASTDVSPSTEPPAPSFGDAPVSDATEQIPKSTLFGFLDNLKNAINAKKDESSSDDVDDTEPDDEDDTF